MRSAKNILAIAALLYALPAAGQRLPNQFPQKSNAEGTDELYTQASGTAYRIVLDSVRMFMAPDIDLVALGYEIDSTGLNVVDSLRGRFVVDASGDWWYVDKDKSAVAVSGGSVEQADGLTILGAGTGGDPFRVDTALMATTSALADSISAAGHVSGSGTLNALAKFTPDGNTIGNADITAGATSIEVGAGTDTTDLNSTQNIIRNVVTIPGYPSSRDDSGSTTPLRPLYTNGFGSLRVAPIGEYDLEANPFGGNTTLQGNLDSLYANSGGGGGSSTFVGLSDTPSSYSTSAGKVATVNNAETALEFSNVLTALPPVNSSLATATDTLDMGSHNIFRLDMSANSDITLALQNGIDGNRYTVQYFNNTGLDSLVFPDNVYCITDTAIGHIANRTDESGVVEFFYDTAYWVVNAIPDCTIESGASPPGGGGDYDADYQAILDWAGTAGYDVPHDTMKTKQNQLVVDLKAASLWDSLDVLYVFAATTADTNFAKINWKDPTAYFAVTQNGGVTYDSLSGFKGNGTSGWIATSILPGSGGSTMYTSSSAHYGLWSYEVPTNTIGKYYYTSFAANSSNVMALRDGSSRLFYKFTSGTACMTDNNTFLADSTAGYIAINAFASSDVFAYRNGNEIASASACSTVIPVTNDRPVILLAGYQNVGSPLTGFAEYRLSVFHLGAGLSASANAALYIAFNTYMSSL